MGEAELSRLNEALQAEIAERKRAEQTLHECLRRKDEFLATLAHELRNPLAPLTSAIHLIAAAPEQTEQVRKLVGMMSQQLEQLSRLIDDLVDVSRITGGKLHLQCEPTSLANFIQAAVDQSRPVIEAARHTFNVALPDEPIIVNGDKVRLAQIVGNLLINAAKYTPPGGRIDLTVRHEASDVLISVRDNGIGIAPQMQARIFELFAQVDSSSPRTHGGLGIGLSIVKTLVELHGGSIRASSEGAGRGSEFIVRLPIAGLTAPAHEPSQQPSDALPLPEFKVLLVDDNQSAVHMMSRLLQKLGQDVHVADSGFAALDQVPKIAPDIVISDVAMPGMSGYDLARHIRTLQLPRRPYLVAVTGYGQESDRQAALAAGFDKHLTKPVGVATLEQLLRSQA
jgi:CheY-like chemotaxis protein